MVRGPGLFALPPFPFLLGGGGGGPRGHTRPTDRGMGKARAGDGTARGRLTKSDDLSFILGRREDRSLTERERPAWTAGTAARSTAAMEVIFMMLAWMRLLGRDGRGSSRLALLLRVLGLRSWGAGVAPVGGGGGCGGRGCACVG